MSVIEELKFFVEDHNQKVIVEDSDIQQEQKVQMTFLKKSVDALHNKLQREQAEHERNRMSVMEINQTLIGNIELLKKEIEEQKAIFTAPEMGGLKEY